MSHLNGNSPLSNGNSRADAPYLLWESSGALCALAANAVREVLLLPAIEPLDGAPQWVGVLDVRGRIVPIVDASEIGGQGRRDFETSDSVVILEGETEKFLGLIVEKVRGVQNLGAHEIESWPSGAHSGLARVEGEIVRLLSLGHLLSYAARPSDENAQFAPARPFCADVSPTERALFDARARAQRAPANSAQSELEADALVVVRLGDETFGLPLHRVREFAADLSVTPVPGGPPDLLGLVNRRGEVVPLLDLRASIGVKREGVAGTQIAFIEWENALWGLALDEILGIFTPLESQLLAPPKTRAKNENVRAAAFYEEKTLAVLDIDNVMGAGGWAAAR